MDNDNKRELLDNLLGHEAHLMILKQFTLHSGPLGKVGQFYFVDGQRFHVTNVTTITAAGDAVNILCA